MDEKKREDKWGMFKQFLHNEMGISKADIKEWVSEAVQDQSRRVVKEMNIHSIVERVVRNEVNSSYGNRLKDSISKEIGKELSKMFIVEVKK